MIFRIISVFDTFVEMEKKKILNDPVYGFINMPKGLAFEIVEQDFFQRLRRIQQLGLTYFVYPGAVHTRFQHTLGASHLMSLALDTLRAKGIDISDAEYQASIQAILMHDVGHAPFSHSLEKVIIQGVSHEDISIALMERFNRQKEGQLDLSLKIFNNKHPKSFLHQLVSSQLDVDRLDYLRRDSFFTGVSEGVVGSDRIIKMMNVTNNQLVVDVKGAYSIEKFLIARRLMYWQVYLHKTVVMAEKLLLNILKRAVFLAQNHQNLFASPAFRFFLYNKLNISNLNESTGVYKATVLDLFTQIDDSDILSAIKAWMHHEDKILSFLSRSLMHRNLFHISLQTKPFEEDKIQMLRREIQNYYNIDETEVDYFMMNGTIKSNAYSEFDDRINILHKDGTLSDIVETSDILELSALSKTIEKHFLAFPKHLMSLI